MKTWTIGAGLPIGGCHAGAYADLSAKRPRALRLLRGRAIRAGAYGDPYAVSDLTLWHDLSRTASVFTGYTHFWRKPDALPPVSGRGPGSHGQVHSAGALVRARGR
jgi:hypothetical protein